MRSVSKSLIATGFFAVITGLTALWSPRAAFFTLALPFAYSFVAGMLQFRDDTLASTADESFLQEHYPDLARSVPPHGGTLGYFQLMSHKDRRTDAQLDAIARRVRGEWLAGSLVLLPVPVAMVALVIGSMIR